MYLINGLLSLSSIYLYDYSVEVCPKLSTPGNGTLSTDISVYGTQVKASCFIGFRFSNETDPVQCMTGSVWNATFGDCIRKHFICHSVNDNSSKLIGLLQRALSPENHSYFFLQQ